MPRFFAPKCPVSVRTKAWTELRLIWLGQQLGMDRLLNSEVVLPTDPFLPVSFSGTEEEVQQILIDLCARMQIRAPEIHLEFLPDEDLPHASGRYEPQEDHAVVRMAQSLLLDSERLVATLIHELSHHVLRGRGLLDPDVPDHEFVTDLLAVFLGLGVFGANSLRQEASRSSGNRYTWQIGMQGYLTANDYGYAMALFAWAREEIDPDWATYLSLDARASLQKGLKYLFKTGDALFGRSFHRDPAALPVSDLLADVEAESEGTRVAALWEVRNRRPNSREAWQSVATCLAHKNPEIRAEAALTLAALSPDAREVSADLLDRLLDKNAEVRANAAYALGVLGADAKDVLPAVTPLLEDQDRLVVHRAVSCIAKYGPEAEYALEELLRVLTSALVECDFQLSELALAAISPTTSDTRALVKECFSADRDLCHQALLLLEEQHAAADREQE